MVSHFRSFRYRTFCRRQQKMQIKQLSLFIENQPGTLSKVSQVLKENDLDIRTLSLADTSEFGILRLLIKDHNRAKDVLEKAGFVVKITDVLAITISNKVGGLADVLSIIDRHHLSIEYMYAFTFSHGDRAVLVFRFNDIQHALNELKDEPVEVLRAEDLYI